MFSTNLIATVAASIVLAGCAFVGPWQSDAQNQQRYALKGGSMLVVDADGRMRMFDIYGAPLYMKDGVAMELKDGTVITMKETVTADPEPGAMPLSIRS
jgi:hypothetical protein